MLRPVLTGETEMEARLKELYPSTRISAVQPSELPGLFEVTMGRNAAFTDTDRALLCLRPPVRHEGAKGSDRAATERHQSHRFCPLPLQDAIKTVRGDGSRKLAVFSDPDCPYCKGLEGELAKLDNVTLYTFLYPLEGLHPEAKGKSDASGAHPTAPRRGRS